MLRTFNVQEVSSTNHQK